MCQRELSIKTCKAKTSIYDNKKREYRFFFVDMDKFHKKTVTRIRHLANNYTFK